MHRTSVSRLWRPATDCIQPLALGGITDGVSNLELTGAFAAIADDGIYRTPKFFTKILNRNGDVLYAFSDLEADAVSANELPDDFHTRTPAGRDNTRVLKDSTAFLLTSAMQGVVADPSGTAYQTVSASGQPSPERPERPRTTRISGSSASHPTTRAASGADMTATKSCRMAVTAIRKHCFPL